MGAMRSECQPHWDEARREVSPTGARSFGSKPAVGDDLFFHSFLVVVFEALVDQIAP